MDYQDGEEGNLRISITTARAVNAEALSYRFVFRGPGGETITRNLEPPATDLTLTVIAGRWDIHADAYTPSGGLYASGDASVLVEAGKPATASIPMGRAAPLLTDPADIGPWLAEAGTIDPDMDGSLTNPIPLRVGFELSAANWSALMTAIYTGDKYVDLDLTVCAMSNTEFDPVPSVSSASKNYIVSLVLPAMATSILAGPAHASAFRYFTNLVDVSGANIHTIGNLAFSNCTALTTADFPATTSIGDGAFRNCTSLATVSLPVATDIGASAFYGCTGLTTVNFPAVETFGSHAFRDCTGLTTVSLPVSLITFTGNPFAGCTNLTGITVEYGNSNYKAENGMLLTHDGTTLIAYPTASGTVTLGSSITSIGDYAFYGCIEVTGVTLDATTDIGASAFYECTGLTTVNASEVMDIGELAFGYCTGLTTINIPAVTNIDPRAFIWTGTTPDLTVTMGVVAPTLGMNIFDGVSYGKNVTVKVPSGATGYGSLPFDNSDTSTYNWGNGFRGCGWDGSAFLPGGGMTSGGINLTIEEYTP
jgi:hypothetical protein